MDKFIENLKDDVKDKTVPILITDSEWVDGTFRDRAEGRYRFYKEYNKNYLTECLYNLNDNGSQ